MESFICNLLERMGNNPEITGIDHNDLTNSVDAILVKKLTQTNTLSRCRDSHQTHIAITGDGMMIFPCMREGANIVDLTHNGRFQKDYVIRINIMLLQNNIDYLRNRCCNQNYSNIINTFTHTARTERGDGTIQTEISYLSLDDVNFLQFRRMFRDGDYLIFLRKRNTYEYLCMGVLGESNLQEAVLYF